MLGHGTKGDAPTQKKNYQFFAEPPAPSHIPSFKSLALAAFEITERKVWKNKKKWIEQ